VIYDMAESDVLNAFNEFDAAFPAIEPGQIKKMNEIIAVLTRAQPALVAVGDKDPNRGNDLAKGFNERMKKVEELSKIPAPKPAPKTTQVVAQSQAPPQQTRVVQTPSSGIQSETILVPAQPTSSASQGEEPIPADIEQALPQFDSIVARADRMTKMDVWTGKSNDLVNEWNKWQDAHAQKFVNLVTQKGHANARLRVYGDKYSRFTNELREKITSLQITAHQREVLNGVSPEYDAIVADFRATNSNAALLRMEALDRKLRELGIPDHPSVVGGLQSTQHALNQMRTMVKI